MEGKKAMDRAGPSNSLLGRLYDRHWGELVHYVVAKFGTGPPDPEDVVQTAFVRYAAAPNNGEIKNERAFLYKTVRNVVPDHKRREVTQGRYPWTKVVRAPLCSINRLLTAPKVYLWNNRLSNPLEFRQGDL